MLFPLSKASWIFLSARKESIQLHNDFGNNKIRSKKIVGLNVIDVDTYKAYCEERNKKIQDQKNKTAIRVAKKQETANKKAIKEAAKVAKQAAKQINAKTAKQTNRKIKQNYHASSTSIQQTDQDPESEDEIQLFVEKSEKRVEAQIITEYAVGDDKLTKPTRTRRIPVRFRLLLFFFKFESTWSL